MGLSQSNEDAWFHSQFRFANDHVAGGIKGPDASDLPSCPNLKLATIVYASISIHPINVSSATPAFKDDSNPTGTAGFPELSLSLPPQKQCPLSRIFCPVPHCKPWWYLFSGHNTPQSSCSLLNSLFSILTSITTDLDSDFFSKIQSWSKPVTRWLYVSCVYLW